MTDIDPAAVMAKHEGHGFSGCYRRATALFLGELPHCEPYRLAQALAASEAKVARVEALVLPAKPKTIGSTMFVNRLRTALTAQPEQAS